VRAPLSRNSIVSATRALVVDRGVDALSLREVAKRLGVTAPALYAHIDDKRDLMAAVAEGEFDHIAGLFAAATCGVEHPVEQVRACGQAYIGHAIDEPELFKVMFQFPPVMPDGEAPPLPAATRAFGVPYAATIEAIECGMFREMDPMMAILAQWAGCHGAATVMLLGMGFDDATRDEMVETVLDTIIRGLLA